MKSYMKALDNYLLFSSGIWTWSMKVNSQSPVRFPFKYMGATEPLWLQVALIWIAGFKKVNLALPGIYLTRIFQVSFIIFIKKKRNSKFSWGVEIHNPKKKFWISKLSWKEKWEYLDISKFLKLRKEKISSCYKKVKKQYSPKFAAKYFPHSGKNNAS